MPSIINNPVITVTHTGSTVPVNATLTTSYLQKNPLTGDFLLIPGSEQSIQAYQAGVQVTLPNSSVTTEASGEEAYLRLVMTGSTCNGHIEDILYVVYFEDSPIPCTSVTLNYSGAIDISNATEDFDVKRQNIVDDLCNGTYDSTGTYYINVSGPITEASVLLGENITISDGPGCSSGATSGWYALSLSGTDCIGGYWNQSLNQFLYARPCSSCLGISP